jgi:hypothetical protein
MKAVVCLSRLAILILFMFATNLFATYRTVSHDEAYQLSSIQQAISVSMPGDTIIVFPGNYTENLLIETPICIIGNSNLDDYRCTKIIGSHNFSSNQISISNIYFQVGNSANISIDGDLSLYSCTLTSSLHCPCMIINGETNVLLSGCKALVYGNTSYEGYMFSGVQIATILAENCKFIGENNVHSQFINPPGSSNYNNCVFHNISIFSSNQYGSQFAINNCLMSNTNIQSSELMTFQYCATTGSWGQENQTNIVIATTSFDNNFHPTVLSPLIDSGNPIIVFDTDGSRCDIGCYGGPTPYNDLGCANWYPHLDAFSVFPGIQEQGGLLHLEASGAIGPTWLGSAPALNDGR